MIGGVSNFGIGDSVFFCSVHSFITRYFRVTGNPDKDARFRCKREGFKDSDDTLAEEVSSVRIF